MVGIISIQLVISLNCPSVFSVKLQLVCCNAHVILSSKLILATKDKSALRTLNYWIYEELVLLISAFRYKWTTFERKGNFNIYSINIKRLKNNNTVIFVFGMKFNLQSQLWRLTAFNILSSVLGSKWTCDEKRAKVLWRNFEGRHLGRFRRTVRKDRVVLSSP